MNIRKGKSDPNKPLFLTFAKTNPNIMNMTTSDYLLIALIVFILLLYPLLRRITSLLEVLVKKYVQSTSNTAEKPQYNEGQITQTVLNLKLLAYERIILFIERMKPDSLIPRTLSPSLTSKEYQLLLIREIRNEFEYNLSQQLYLSEDSWVMTSHFKDNIITLINTASTECDPTATAGELAKKILEQYIHSDIKVDLILKAIKAEIN